MLDDEITICTKKYWHLNIILLFFFLKIININCDDIECKKNSSLLNTNCFNNIKLFNSKKYRAGHFASNKKGDLIIEFSEDDGDSCSSRLFYGLKSDGRYFFNEEKAIYEFNINGAKVSEQNSDYYYARYESKNLFVSLESDDNNEYLFSVSSFNSLAELHNLTNTGNEHITWTTKNFFNFVEEHIHSFEYSLFQIKNESAYVVAFIPKTPNLSDDKGDTFKIIKFKFQSFDTNTYQQINMTEYKNNCNNRIISAFSMDDCNIIVVFFFNKTKTENDKDFGKYTYIMYDYDLNYKSSRDFEVSEFSVDGGDGIFFKGLYLTQNFAAFIYFTTQYNGKSLFFETCKFLKNGDNPELNNIINYNINTINFNTYVSLSDFLKIDDKRVVFISSEGDNENVERKIHFLLFDLYKNYTDMKIRIYSFNINDYIIQKELSGFIYNGYLLFDTTSVLKREGMNDTHWKDYFSIFMIIGYANGTDSTIDISSFLQIVIIIT